MRSAFKVAGFITVAVAAGLIGSLALHFIHTSSAVEVDDVKYTDFLSITLTALSLMVTILGIFIAVAGVVGWATLESKLKAHSVDYFAEQLKQGAPLRGELELFFSQIAHSGIEGLREPPTEERPYTDD